MAIATIEQTGTRRFPRWLFWVIVFLLLLLAVYAAWRISIRRAIAQELAEMKAQGYPTTLAELDAWYKYPVGKNAADEIVPALKRIMSPEDVFGKRQVDAQPWIDAGMIEGTSGGIAAGPGEAPGGPGIESTNMRDCVEWIPYFGQCQQVKVEDSYPAECLHLIEEFSNANQTSLDELTIASRNTAARYPVDLKMGMRALMPSLGMMRRASMALALQGIAAEGKGDNELATRSIITQIALANSLKTCSDVVSQLARNGCIYWAIGTAQRAILHLDLQPEQMMQLQAAFADSDDPIAFQRALVGETLCIHDSYLHLDPREVMEQDDSSRFYFDQFMGVVDYSDLASLRFHKQFIVIAGMPDHFRLDESAKVMAKYEQAQSRFLTRYVMVPALDRLLVSNLRSKTATRCAVAGIACERWRLERGAWPTGWSELVPGYLDAEPVDPFTGKALLMKVDGGVLTVYSVGDDLTDNGGVRVNSAGREYEAGADIPFVVGK